jgi:hypothetical protein
MTVQARGAGGVVGIPSPIHPHTALPLRASWGTGRKVRPPPRHVPPPPPLPRRPLLQQPPPRPGTLSPRVHARGAQAGRGGTRMGECAHEQKGAAEGEGGGGCACTQRAGGCGQGRAGRNQDRGACTLFRPPRPSTSRLTCKNYL